MLLREDELAALNDVHAACMRTVEQIEALAAGPSAPSDPDRVGHLLDCRREFCARLAALIRAHDDQPKLADPDREAIAGWVARVGDAFAENDRVAGWERQALAEREFEQLIMSSLDAVHSAEATALLTALLEHVRDDRKTLSGAPNKNGRALGAAADRF